MGLFNVRKKKDDKEKKEETLTNAGLTSDVSVDDGSNFIKFPVEQDIDKYLIQIVNCLKTAAMQFDIMQLYSNMNKYAWCIAQQHSKEHLDNFFENFNKNVKASIRKTEGDLKNTIKKMKNKMQNECDKGLLNMLKNLNSSDYFITRYIQLLNEKINQQEGVTS